MPEEETDKLFHLYSRAELSGVELRRALGGLTFGDILIELARRNLPLPRASGIDRERRIATARAWLFPKVPE